jgi:uncharacterized OB-fold protein
MCFRPTEITMNKCPKCGAMNKPIAKVCEKCGEPLEFKKVEMDADAGGIDAQMNAPAAPKAPGAPGAPAAPKAPGAPAAPAAPKAPGK